MTPTFERAVTKLHRQQKIALDGAVSTIASQRKNLFFLLAYRILDESTLKLLMVGPHENFYRDLKRTEH